MADRQVVLVCVAGAETEAFWGRVRTLLPADAEVELYHVVDDAPARELEVQFLRRPGHPLPPHLDARTRAAESRGSDAVLGDAALALGGVAGTTVGRGRPEWSIVERAAEVSASLVIVGCRPGELSTPPEPHSVGHVARFVLDHAPCPVLLVRLAPDSVGRPALHPPGPPRPMG
jgi:nucleotide-binding universal stress UspA family protein